MGDNMQAVNEENARLRARIDALESELDLRAKSDKQGFSEAMDLARGIPGKLMDEATRCSRGLAAATVESVRVSTESFDQFAAELTRPDVTPDVHPLGSLLLDFPKRAFTGLVKAVSHSIDGQSRTLNKFFESYNASLKQTGTGA